MTSSRSPTYRKGREFMVAIAILAAGKGTRMRSTLPKVLHRLGGRSLVEWVLESVKALPLDDQFAIVGYQAAMVEDALGDRVRFVEQREQLGTGHAVQQLLPHLAGFDGDLLILNGDVPLLRAETLANLVATHQRSGNDATLLTAILPNPKGYGRVFCDDQNRLKQIIEDRDCTPAQRTNGRVNAGIYCFKWSALAKALPQLTTDNDQKEYYLTQAIDFMGQVMAFDVADHQEILGINDRRQLAEAYKILQQRIKEDWMAAGVTIVDPDSVTIDDTVTIGLDAIIEPQTHLRGATTIGPNCRIGPGSLIENSTIAEGSSVLYSVVSDSQIAANGQIGPYAHLRAGASIGPDCRIGNFVEIKNSTIGPQTNAAHLAYLGDATLGERVNVGAGTITANYDGVTKHKTIIGDRAKTGANSVLVAPVTIGSDATIAAGSTITQDVPSKALAIGRSRQANKADWKGPIAK
jgi:bifunctional UDP-N-acetylglucosamine pyrophosphorylase / glucosamine-1-phosphate N-acetyltransferase